MSQFTAEVLTEAKRLVLSAYGLDESGKSASGVTYRVDNAPLQDHIVILDVFAGFADNVPDLEIERIRKIYEPLNSLNYDKEFPYRKGLKPKEITPDQIQLVLFKTDSALYEKYKDYTVANDREIVALMYAESVIVGKTENNGGVVVADSLGSTIDITMDPEKTPAGYDAASLVTHFTDEMKTNDYARTFLMRHKSPHGFIFTPAFDGFLIRVYQYRGTVFFSTHSKILAEGSFWPTRPPFYFIFLHVMMSMTTGFFFEYLFPSPHSTQCYFFYIHSYVMGLTGKSVLAHPTPDGYNVTGERAFLSQVSVYGKNALDADLSPIDVAWPLEHHRDRLERVKQEYNLPNSGGIEAWMKQNYLGYVEGLASPIAAPLVMDPLEAYHVTFPRVESCWVDEIEARPVQDAGEYQTILIEDSEKDDSTGTTRRTLRNIITLLPEKSGVEIFHNGGAAPAFGDSVYFHAVDKYGNIMGAVRFWSPAATARRNVFNGESNARHRFLQLYSMKTEFFDKHYGEFITAPRNMTRQKAMKLVYRVCAYPFQSEQADEHSAYAIQMVTKIMDFILLDWDLLKNDQFVAKILNDATRASLNRLYAMALRSGIDAEDILTDYNLANLMSKYTRIQSSPAIADKISHGPQRDIYEKNFPREKRGRTKQPPQKPPVKSTRGRGRGRGRRT